MKLLRTLIALTGATVIMLTVSAAAAAPTEALLRERAVVTGDVVTLGDIFVNAGTHAGEPVSRAPAPGTRAAIASAHVAKAARANGLLWPNRERYTHIIVNREGTRVPLTAIEAALAAEIEARPAGGGETYRVSLDREPDGLFVAKGDVPDVTVAGLDFDPTTGTFRARVAPRGTETEPLRITGRAVAIRRVPVPAEPIARGEVIRPDMLNWIDVEAARMGPGIATTEAELVGMAAKSSLRRGSAVRTANLRAPIALEKDATITIVFEVPGMVLTAQGRALANGALNEVIPVVNTRSHRTVHARVVAPDRVIVEAAMPMLVAGQATN